MQNFGSQFARGRPFFLVFISLLACTRGEIAEFSIGSNSYACFPQHAPSKESFPSTLKYPKDVVFLPNRVEACCDKDRNLAVDVLEGLGNIEVVGKVVAYRLCSEATTRSEYWTDYYFKALALKEEGAAVLVAGEAFDAKLPEHMDTELTRTLGIPVCSMELHVFERLVQTVDGGAVTADFSNVPFYRRGDEPVLDTPVTGVQLKAAGSTAARFVPAATVTFNPSESDGAEGTLIRLRLAADCYAAQDDDWPACVRCWSSGRIGNADGPVENFGEVAGSAAGLHRILFVSLDADGIWDGGASTCYSYFYHWSAIAEKLFARGLVIGGVRESALSVAGPYLVGSKVVPTFSVLSVDSEAILGMLMTSGPVTAALPELLEKQGLPFYSEEDRGLGLTRVLFWEDSLDRSGRYFECLAGQATYNPTTHSGVPAPRFDARGNMAEGSYTLVVPVGPSGACGDRSRCAECLQQGAAKLSLSGESYRDSILLLSEADFPCFHSRSEFSLAAAAADPLGLIIGQMTEVSHSVESGDDSLPSHLPFPTFTVNSACYSRVIADCGGTEGAACASRVAAQLPEIEGGVAGSRQELAYTDSMEEAQITFSSPLALKQMGIILVGQTNFNPREHSHVEADIIVAETNEACNSLETCLECDALPWSFNKPRSDFADKVVLFSRFLVEIHEIDFDSESYMTIDFRHSKLQGRCLFPWSNIVRELESAGAAGVVFLDGDNMVRSLVEEGIPAPVGIPAFNLPLEVGIRVLVLDEANQNQLIPQARTGLKIRLPRLAAGVAVPRSVGSDTVREASGEGAVPDSGDVAGPGKIKIPVWAIVLIALAVLPASAGMYCLWIHIKRRKRMYTYNRMSTSMQTDDFDDLSYASESASPGIRSALPAKDLAGEARSLQLVGLRHEE